MPCMSGCMPRRVRLFACANVLQEACSCICRPFECACHSCVRMCMHCVYIFQCMCVSTMHTCVYALVQSFHARVAHMQHVCKYCAYYICSSYILVLGVHVLRASMRAGACMCADTVDTCCVHCGVCMSVIRARAWAYEIKCRTARCRMISGSWPLVARARVRKRRSSGQLMTYGMAAWGKQPTEPAQLPPAARGAGRGQKCTHTQHRYTRNNTQQTHPHTNTPALADTHTQRHIHAEHAFKHTDTHTHTHAHSQARHIQGSRTWTSGTPGTITEMQACLPECT